MRALLPTQTLPVRGHALRYHVQGEGEPLLLLHGFPETLQAWSGHAETFAKRFRVHAFDWPGLGGSDAPRGFDYSHEGYATLIEDVMDTLGIASAHLVATDIAVPPALFVALRKPGRVERLVVFDGPVFHRPRLNSWEVRALRVPLLGELLVHGIPRTMTWVAFQRGFHGPPRISKDQYEDYQAQARRQRTREVTLALFRGDTRFFLALEREIHALQTPMLILWGEDDVFIRVQMALLLKAACPHARLEVVPQCGHFLHEEAPEYFQEQVMGFLSHPHQ